MLSERCDRLREEVTLEALFDTLGWDLPDRGKIVCLWPDHDDQAPSMQIYRDTNSVHCFSCGRSGDVVEILWKAGNPEGGEWSLEDAVDWAEAAFGLAPIKPTQTLRNRMRKKLSRLHSPAPVTVDRAGVALLDAGVRADFTAVHANATQGQIAAMGAWADYIWGERDEGGVDLVTWAAWARGVIRGPYATALQQAPRNRISLEERRCSILWELHRDNEPNGNHLNTLVHLYEE
jgi:hypothetical protein